MEDSMEELENLIAGIEGMGTGGGEPSKPPEGPSSEGTGGAGRIGRVIRRIEVEASRASESVKEVISFLEVFCFLAPASLSLNRNERREERIRQYARRSERNRRDIPMDTRSPDFEMHSGGMRAPDILRTLAQTGGCGVAKC